MEREWTEETESWTRRERAVGRQNTASRERSAGEGGEKEEEAEMMGLAEV